MPQAVSVELLSRWGNIHNRTYFTCICFVFTIILSSALPIFFYLSLTHPGDRISFCYMPFLYTMQWHLNWFDLNECDCVLFCCSIYFILHTVIYCAHVQYAFRPICICLARSVVCTRIRTSEKRKQILSSRTDRHEYLPGVDTVLFAPLRLYECKQ